jgi:hypothetical protein
MIESCASSSSPDKATAKAALATIDKWLARLLRPARRDGDSALRLQRRLLTTPHQETSPAAACLSAGSAKEISRLS